MQKPLRSLKNRHLKGMGNDCHCSGSTCHLPAKWTFYYLHPQILPSLLFCRTSLSFLLREIASKIHTHAASSITVVAAHVIPRNIIPLYAAIPTLSPCWLMTCVTSTDIALAIADATPKVRKASYQTSQHIIICSLCECIAC